MSDLDEMLNRPLATVPDDGFSARVATRIRHRALLEEGLLWTGLTLLAAILLLFVPLVPAAGALTQVLSRAVASPALAMATGALVLIWAWEPRFLRF